MSDRGLALRASELVKVFGPKRAVDGISLDVPAGQVCALLGPNGAGKTTTIHMLLGLTLPTSGSVSILGHDVVKDRANAIARTNFMASYVSLPHRVTVREALRVSAELYAVDRPRQAVEEVIERFRLGHLASTFYAKLSSGQQTMVGMAKALVNNPEVLFLDEPTASLDPENAYEVRLLLREVASERGTTIIITSHNMTEVERIADRIVIMSAGRLVADGAAGELRDQFQAADLEEVFLQVARQGRET